MNAIVDKATLLSYARSATTALRELEKIRIAESSLPEVVSARESIRAALEKLATKIGRVEMREHMK